MKPHNTHARFCAFSIVEVLVAVAVLGTAAAIAIPLISTTNANVKATKLSNELKTLNLAVKSFIANGGEINPDDGLTEMIEKLKQELSDIDAQKQAGFSGQHIDSRLTPVLIDKDTKGPRLYWNPESLRFEETTKQVDGIKEFILTDYTGKRETNRKASGVYQYSDDDKGWVWNHGSAGTKNLVTPSLVSTTPSADGDDTTPILISLVPTGDSPPERVIDFSHARSRSSRGSRFFHSPGKIQDLGIPSARGHHQPESRIHRRSLLFRRLR